MEFARALDQVIQQHLDELKKPGVLSLRPGYQVAGGWPTKKPAIVVTVDRKRDDLSPQDHAWLDELTQERAFDFAAEHGYDLRDYVHGGSVADWWGFTWMILAEARGVLTAEKRAAAWCRHGQRTWWA